MNKRKSKQLNKERGEELTNQEKKQLFENSRVVMSFSLFKDRACRTAKGLLSVNKWYTMKKSE